MESKHHLKKNGIAINFDKCDLMFSRVENGFIHPPHQAPHQQKDFLSSTVADWLLLNWNRSIVKNCFPFLLFLVVYGLNDTLHLLPGIGDLNCVNFHNISALEYRIFSGRPPHLFFSSRSSFALDLLSALPYLFHYTIPILFPLFLAFGGLKAKISRFFKLLSVSMWCHYVIWFMLPTAPPWLADKLEQIRAIEAPAGSSYSELLHREGCAFARLDAQSGWGFFKSIFDGNPVPFASFPSGHVAWPLCMALTTYWSKKVKVFFVMYIAWVGWSTMYSCHHYFSDIIAAILVVLSVEIVERKYIRNRPGN